MDSALRPLVYDSGHCPLLSRLRHPLFPENVHPLARILSQSHYKIMKNAEPQMTARNKRRAAGRTLRQSFVVNLQHGLHARPCAQLVKTLRPFRSTIDVEANGQQANGHSIMGLMALAAGRECTLTFTITGPDAPEAMNAVNELFETDFSQQTFSAAV